MSYTVIIPARYQSTRFPGKPLIDIEGKPMIQRVYEAASKSSAAQVLVATDDNRIKKEVEGFGAEAYMTSEHHPSGTDRLHEVVEQLGLADNDIVVNVQGDEPLIDPALIDQVANNLASLSWASIATLCEPLSDWDSIFNPNNVKAVFGKDGEALYFSRSVIPWQRDNFEMSQNQNGSEHNSREISVKSSSPEKNQFYRHIGIYAYRVSFLKAYVNWPPAELEKLESLEQLRAMSNGHKIHIEASCAEHAPGVDTPEDLEVVREIFRQKTNG